VPIQPSMLRAFSILLAALALVAVPATAVAAKPDKAGKPDKGAKPGHSADPGKSKKSVAAPVVARAFADAALQAAPEIEAASMQLRAIGEPVSCAVEVPDARRAEVDRLAGKLATAKIISSFTRTVATAMRRTTKALDATETGDRTLRRGRDAWHDVRSDYADFAEHPDRAVCRQVAAYVANGYRHTYGTRRGVRAYRDMIGWDTTSIDRRLKAAVKRLVKLGVPADEAAAFAGGLG
jgi:hypothetical protein